MFISKNLHNFSFIHSVTQTWQPVVCVVHYRTYLLKCFVLRMVCEVHVKFVGFFSGLGDGEKLKMSRQFSDERWTKHRSVTSLDWSVQVREVIS